jgi:DNA polymerase-1
VTTAEALDALADRLKAAAEFGLRIVTDDVSAVRAAIVGFALTVADRHAAYVPVGHSGGDDAGDLLSAASRPVQLELATVLDRLKPLLEDAAVHKLGYDLKQDTILLARHGITLRGVRFDALLGSYLLDASRSSHALPEIALEHLGYTAIDEQSVAGKGVKAVPMSQLAPEAVLKLACERVDVARQLSRKLEPMLDTEQLAASTATSSSRSSTCWPTSSVPAFASTLRPWRSRARSSRTSCWR